MARFKRLEVLNTMVGIGLVPVFFNKDLAKAKKIVEAVRRGGCRIIEFTNRGDHAFEIFSLLEVFCSKEFPDMIVGTGSVVDAPTAGMYINCGSNFIVGPVLNPEVARICNRRKVAYSPGCGSASEIGAAEELGCEIIKIFPGDSVGGPSFVKSILGPCPWTSLMPTGGAKATEDSLKSWFSAGVVCVGIGSDLITKELVGSENWLGLAEKVAETLSIIKKLRGKQ